MTVEVSRSDLYVRIGNRELYAHIGRHWPAGRDARNLVLHLGRVELILSRL
jgi:hypothetical protein